MALTDRSRLGCIKRKRERMQRKLDNQNRNIHSASALEQSESAQDLKDLSAREKAWKKYLHAKAIYDETKQAEHWQYMQTCISEYEKTLKSNLGVNLV